MDNQFSTPVLLIVFNRPKAVNRVIQNLRDIKPTKIYIGADGPRQTHPDDYEKCEQTRAIIKTIDWPCEIFTLYRSQNFGCRNAVHGAISWFFENEEAGIILEDDCIPDASFFQFSKELLEKYKDNNQVMHIAGDNPIGNITNSISTSYSFASMPLVWGWATWRSAWQQMNLTLDGIEEFQFSSLPLSSLSQKYLAEKFWATKNKENDSWAYAWYFTILQHKGVCILPKINLVQNIGFNEKSTHTKSPDKTREIESRSLSFPLIHPPKPVINKKIEQPLFNAAQKSKIGLLGRYWFPKWFRAILGAGKK